MFNKLNSHGIPLLESRELLFQVYTYSSASGPEVSRILHYFIVSSLIAVSPLILALLQLYKARLRIIHGWSVLRLMRVLLATVVVFLMFHSVLNTNESLL